MSEPNMHGASDDWNKLKHLVDLSAENARLKAEVEQIRKAVDEHLTPIPEHTTVMEVERLCTAWSLMSNSLDAQWKRIEQLKAEVQRLKSLCDNLGMGGKHTVTAIADENARLKAEVERLRKAGDAMADAFVDCLVSQRLFPSESPSLKRWIDAKKGNPNE